MTDYFALLGQPRRPWLDPAEVQKAFVAAANAFHPDRVHRAAVEEKARAQARYTALNQASQCLGKPHTRLRHFIELERGGKVSDLHEIAPELMALFGEVGNVCREADQLITERSAVSSPLLKVALFERAQAIRDHLETVRQKVQTEVSRLEQRLQSADAVWAGPGTAGSDREELLAELERLFRLFSFHDRWLAQLQARWLQLVA